MQQLIGPLKLWTGIDTSETPAYARHSGPKLGAEAIGFSDCGFSARVTPAGLLNGLCVLNVVAGARNQRYLQLWSGAA